jgi:hypothetical protein
MRLDASTRASVRQHAHTQACASGHRRRENNKAPKLYLVIYLCSNSFTAATNQPTGLLTMSTVTVTHVNPPVKAKVRPYVRASVFIDFVEFSLRIDVDGKRVFFRDAQYAYEGNYKTIVHRLQEAIDQA